MNSMTKRCVEMAELLLDKKITVREVAKIIGYSKSTVHKDLTERLQYVDARLYEDVKDLLSYNKKVRHIRGGMATKEKYMNKITNQH